jgi:protein gp37
MGENSKIEWTDHTFNPWIGCQKVSPGCDHCYAEAMMDTRYGRVKWGPHGERKRTSEANWRKPIAWDKAAAMRGVRARVFCASLADVFDNQVPREWRDDLWDLIAWTKELDWLLLTKRPQNITKMLPQGWPWPNVWLGTTAEDQKHYDMRWKVLSAIPAKVRFISHEPSLGDVYDLRGNTNTLPDWIIMGGESGGDARDMPVERARGMREVCHISKIPFFFKQMAHKAPIPRDLLVKQFPH